VKQEEPVETNSMMTLNRRRMLLLSAGAAVTATPLAAQTPAPGRAQAPSDRARITVDVTGGNFTPIPIAVPDLVGDSQLGAQMAGVIRANLQRAGYFQVLEPRSYVERVTSVDVVPNFQSWRVINAQLLAIGGVQRGGSGLVAQLRLFDVFGGQQQEGRQFTIGAENWRRLAHILSDAIYASATGLGGYFDSRIAFVDETGARNQRQKRLAIMDQDGANVRYLTQGGPLVLTPRFNPQNNQLTYMQFGSDDPRVYLLDLQSGSRQTLGQFPGMTFSPRFSPDGRRVIMSVLNRDGNSNLAVMDLGSRNLSRITQGAQIDTSASFAPDGSRIVFESDRGGGQQLYVMSAGGGGPNRISFGDGRYSTPVWSPRGDLIAFTKQTRGGFALGVMTPEGQRERILTQGFHAEGPTWAPNGQVLMFFKEQGPGPRLFSIDVSGRFEQQVPTPSFASDPAWSPLLT
jgi:TolB protein